MEKNRGIHNNNNNHKISQNYYCVNELDKFFFLFIVISFIANFKFIQTRERSENRVEYSLSKRELRIRLRRLWI